MPRNETVVEFTELLGHAVTLGYDWNGAHDILVMDEIPPMYEITKRTWYLSDFKGEDYDFSEDTRKIMINFFEVNKLTEFLLIND